GGTMRLGSYECELKPGSLAAKVYQSETISERHRHRYEFNTEYEKVLAEKGLIISGRSPDGKFVEMVELPDHPWFLGCQFHPELRSRPLAPHPLFTSFIKAAIDYRAQDESTSGTDQHRPVKMVETKANRQKWEIEEVMERG
ncbi:MAG: CTP synthase, partial [bacterium]